MHLNRCTIFFIFAYLLGVFKHFPDEPIEESEPNTVSLRRVIPVRDVNDNPPIFRNRPYIVNISEAIPVGSEIEVTTGIKAY